MPTTSVAGATTPRISMRSSTKRCATPAAPEDKENAVAAKSATKKPSSAVKGKGTKRRGLSLVVDNTSSSRTTPGRSTPTARGDGQRKKSALVLAVEANMNSADAWAALLTGEPPKRADVLLQLYSRALQMVTPPAGGTSPGVFDAAAAAACTTLWKGFVQARAAEADAASPASGSARPSVDETSKWYKAWSSWATVAVAKAPAAQKEAPSTVQVAEDAVGSAKPTAAAAKKAPDAGAKTTPKRASQTPVRGLRRGKLSFKFGACWARLLAVGARSLGVGSPADTTRRVVCNCVAFGVLYRPCTARAARQHTRQRSVGVAGWPRCHRWPVAGARRRCHAG